MSEQEINLKNNLTMLTDFYELTMANGYFENGFENTIAYFDMFFRKVPDGGGFAIMAGVQQVVEYLENLTFTREDIEFLRGKGFPSFLRCLGGARGQADFSGRAHCHRARTGDPGSVCGNDDPALHQPSEPDRHQGQPNRPGCPGQGGNGIWFPPGSGSGWSGYGLQSGLYRRLCGNGVHLERPGF